MSTTESDPSRISESAWPKLYVPPEVPTEVAPVWKTAAVLLFLGFCSFWTLDHVVAKHFVTHGGLPGDVDKVFDAAEHFGTVFGQAFILLAVFALDRRRSYLIPRLAATAILGGLAADVVKLGIGRERPKYFDFTGIADSFSGWLPIGVGGSQYQSFPSAHTASAVAFAVAMCWAYPKGKWLFLSLAGLVALQRIEGNAHYISDTFVGAALGWVVGCGSVRNSRLSRWWNAREEQWMQSSWVTPRVELMIETFDLDQPNSSHEDAAAETRQAA